MRKAVFMAVVGPVLSFTFLCCAVLSQDRAASPPADDALVIANADNGKTLTARVGQSVRVELKGERAGTGWEVGFTPTVLERIRVDAEAQKRIGGPTELNDFVRADGAADPAVGTYVFLFKALRDGEQLLRFIYVYPGGPIARPRLATQLVAEFKATLKVSAAVTGESDGLKTFSFGQSVNGLRLGLKTEGDHTRPLTVQLAIQNVSDRPVLVFSALRQTQTVWFDVTDPDGAPLAFRGRATDWDVPDYAKAVKQLKPGEFVSGVMAVIGFEFAKNGNYTVTARYVWRHAQPPAGRAAEWKQGPIWTGELKSASVTCPRPASGLAGRRDVSEEGWDVVCGELADYKKDPAKEEVRHGKMVLENYGKPGAMYIRPPINYYVQNKEGKVMLGPPADELFGKLDGENVQVKGKVKNNPPGPPRAL